MAADLARFLAPVAAPLGAVELELQRLLHSDVPVVRELAGHVARGRGKRLRPALLLLASRCLGYEGVGDVRFAAVYELIHTATLVHDDVIDHADTRRSSPTLNRVWGNTLTVLFGDLLYIRAMDCAIQGRDFRVLEILADVTGRMIEGELIQNHVLHRMDTSRQDYFEILERKTALLFGGCLETAAVLAGRGEAVQAALRAYGLGLGRAFQLVDDLLDYTATPEQLGKPAFSDLREGKLTLPLLTLLERAPGETRPLVERIWAGEDPEAGILLRDLLGRHEALEETRRLARDASHAARTALEDVPGDPQLKALLLEIPDQLVQRTA